MKIFKLVLVLVLFQLGSKNNFAQSPSINHIALYVYDIKKSTAFYRDVMQFKQIDEPFHDGKHVWFKIGKHSQLHIIEGAKEVKQQDKNTHLAYSVKSLSKFIDNLEKLKIKYEDWKGEGKIPTSRIDGVKQVYLQDPDNFWLEVNDDKY